MSSAMIVMAPSGRASPGNAAVNATLEASRDATTRPVSRTDCQVRAKRCSSERRSIIGTNVVHDADGSAVAVAHGDDDDIRAQRPAELLRGLVVRFVGFDGASEGDAGIEHDFSNVIAGSDVDGADQKSGDRAGVVMQRRHLRQQDVIVIRTALDLPLNDWGSAGSKQLHSVLDLFARHGIAHGIPDRRTAAAVASRGGSAAASSLNRGAAWRTLVRWPPRSNA